MYEIKIEDVSIGYGKKVIAKGLTATLRGGEFVCLVGKNGLGKSTFLKVLSGFLKPLAGKLEMVLDNNCYNITDLPKKELSRFVSVVLTEKVDISNLTVKAVVGMGRMPYTGFFGKLGKDDEKIVDDVMTKTGISEFANRDINTLSDGERQKVMIARALAQQTPVILLDEPTAFLDYENKISTMKILHSLANDTGKIVLTSTHDLDIAVRYADRIITMAQGIQDVDKAVLSQKLNGEG